MSGRARRTSRTGDTGSAANAGYPAARLAAPPELIVVTYPEARVRTSGPALTAAASEHADELTSALGEAVLRPLFAPTEERAEAAGRAVPGAPDLSTFYRVEAPPEALEGLARDLIEAGAVSTAYVKPPTEPATAPGINDMVARPDAPATTPDYISRQFYLDAAPSGVDARFAWTRTGGKGAGVRVVDVEGAWRFSHEDLIANQGGVVGGTESPERRWRDHGTAVVGVIGSDENGFGTTGIAPDASVFAVSIFGDGQGSAKAIRDAADRLGPGDILLIELHRPGPRHGFASRDDQLGYIAVEWWDDDFAAIAYATAKGVIVVEAAGNGAENLDDPLYAIRPDGFPLSWTNPFDRANRDSGALLVGAGAPPPGTHGRDHGPDRSRLDFSNFGASVDVQGVGREVTHHRLRRPAGRELRGHLVHRPVLWDVELVAGGGRGAGLRAGGAAGRQQAHAHPGHRAVAAAEHRHPAAGRPGPPRQRAHRQPARPEPDPVAALPEDGRRGEERLQGGQGPSRRTRRRTTRISRTPRR